MFRDKKNSSHSGHFTEPADGNVSRHLEHWTLSVLEKQIIYVRDDHTGSGVGVSNLGNYGSLVSLITQNSDYGSVIGLS